MSAEKASPSLSWPPSLAQVIAEFSGLPDSRSRLAKLIEWGRSLEPLPEGLKSDAHRVPGCLSVVHIVAHRDDDGRIFFRVDADALLVKGLVALLIRGLNGLSAAEIASLSPDFILETGIKQSLVPSRANGFRNIFLKMQEEAKKLQARS